jgi:Sulfite exporter TauE/SafE
MKKSKEIREIHRIKNRDDYDFDDADLDFEKSEKIRYLVLSCFAAGVLSGILGIAGGVIMSPLFLSMGMLPQVVASTNQYIGMISSLSVTLQFMFNG